ncbi:MAG TPA: cytochrome c biogenesis heme-transporting ATPase CcmA [Methylococcaceae bacterium]|nr:cytochrome c biogenesis heme-transporting ATPase CcmA [Methylococcaceae bacterium]
MQKSAESSAELEADRLECQRGGRTLFCGLSFALHAGEALLVEGENGSGKTSLLRLLCGLSRPASGEVRWRGRAIAAQRAEYARDMAWLGHQHGVKPELQTFENLAFAAALRGEARRDGVERALETVGLGEQAEVAGRALSAGQKQRLALARLLLSRARLWILDEPFTALDAGGGELVRTLIENHLGEGGLAVLTSHQPVSLQVPLARLGLTG